MITLLTKTQYIMGFNGPVDVNQLAVWEAIDRFNVAKPLAVFNRVIRAHRRIMSKEREDRE